jgi:polyisoprenoid-binding protein YceI
MGVAAPRSAGGALVLSAFSGRCLCAVALAATFFVVVPLVRAQDVVVNLDPATTQVQFTLAATLHTVHGVFKLKTGQIHFDPATGKAGGVVVLDATSANTDNSSRDQKMRSEILESARFPEITFTPIQVIGPLADVLAGKSAQLQIAGVFRLHGQDHPMTIRVAVVPAAGAGRSGRLQASSAFDVPYVKWGLKNPSTFVLRVSDMVNLEIHSAAQISHPPANH